MSSRIPVLIITYYWPPSGGAGVQRFLKFAKYLPGEGIDPVVLTCSNPTYPLTDPTLQEEIPLQVPVFKARTIEPFRLGGWLSGTPADHLASTVTALKSDRLGPAAWAVRWLRANFFIPDARIGWVPFARARALKLIRNRVLKAVITTGPPHSAHFIGQKLKQKTGIAWIADFRDPWTDIHYNRALPRTALTRWLDLRMEQHILTRADAITVTAPGTAGYFSEKVSRTYHTLPNGFDPEDFNPKAQVSADNEAGRQAAYYLIRHTGSLPETSLPEGLLQAIAQYLPVETMLEFIGPVHDDLHRLVHTYHLQNRVRFLPYLPHREATLKMQKADMNVVVVQRSNDSRILIPGKLYDYLKAGKPILLIGPTNGDAASIVTRCGMGAAFNYDDAAGMGKWIESQINERYKPGSAPVKIPPLFSPREHEVDSYSRIKLAGELARIIASVLENRQPDSK